MEIRQYNDGSAEIVFSDDEKKIIEKNSSIKLTQEGLRHFGNNLVKIVVDFQTKFDDKTKQISSYSDDVEAT